MIRSLSRASAVTLLALVALLGGACEVHYLNDETVPPVFRSCWDEGGGCACVGDPVVTEPGVASCTAAQVDGLCCADPAFPESDVTGCTCRPVGCFILEPGFCQCTDFGGAAGSIGNCAGTTTGVCCATLGSGCYCGDAPSCNAGETRVDQCQEATVTCSSLGFAGSWDVTSCSLDPPPGPTCGNGGCEAGEGCAVCPEDCGLCPSPCGDGVCGAGEECDLCVSDCGVCPAVCGDTVCEQNENCDNCSQDCGQCCGNGTCDFGEDCETCEDDCGECCGDDACVGSHGESCSTCPQDCGACCGNGQCLGAETCSNCPQDCGVCCGNGSCAGNETWGSCWEDCENEFPSVTWYCGGNAFTRLFDAQGADYLRVNGTDHRIYYLSSDNDDEPSYISTWQWDGGDSILVDGQNSYWFMACALDINNACGPYLAYLQNTVDVVCANGSCSFDDDYQYNDCGPISWSDPDPNNP